MSSCHREEKSVRQRVLTGVKMGANPVALLGIKPQPFSTQLVDCGFADLPQSDKIFIGVQKRI
jgi:hypothetical protein